MGSSCERLGTKNIKFRMIRYLKDKYYWFRNYNKLSNSFEDIKEKKILLFGYPKSGNTWVRFLLYNYCNLLLDPLIKDTITYDRLNDLQKNIMDRGHTFPIELGFPFLYRTHAIYNKSYNLFDYKIFVHRNPLDTLISSYYFYKEREAPFMNDIEDIRKDLYDIDFYIRYKINDWIRFFKISKKVADISINYFHLQKNPLLIISRLISDLGLKYDEDLIQRTIQISSFDSIKKMENKQNQAYGNGPKDGSFKGSFTRSGKDGQYNYELSKETIDFVFSQFPEFTEIYKK